MLLQTNVSWAGALVPKDCNCEDYQTNGTGVPYGISPRVVSTTLRLTLVSACTSGIDSGDWAGGEKYFHDDEMDPSYVLTQIVVNIYGSFDCYSDQDLTVMYVLLILFSPRLQTILKEMQDFMSSCQVNLLDSPSSFSHLLFSSSFPCPHFLTLISSSSFSPPPFLILHSFP